MELGQSRVGRGGSTLIAPPRQLVEEQAAGLEAQLHVDDPVGDGLELPDRRAELAALPGIADTALQLALHSAYRRSKDEASFPVAGGLKHDHARPRWAQEILLRDCAGREDELTHRRSVQPHL